MADANAHPHLQSHHCNRVRRGQWCALTSFSILALVAIRKARLDENGTPMPSEAKVVEPTIVVVLVMSAFSAIAHVALTDMFVGSIAEGVLSIVSTAAWAMVLLYTMDPNRKVAITAEYRGISNPILFFFSWAAWITSFWIMMGFPWKGHSMQQRDWPFMPYAPSSSHWVWYGFVMMSLVIVTTARCMVAKGHCADASRDWSDTALPSKERCNSLRAATGLGSCSFVLSIVWLIVDSIVMDHYIVGALLALLTYSASWLMFDKENQSSVLATKYFYPLLGASWLMVLTMLARNWRIAASMILAAFRYRETDLVHSLIHDQSNITHQEVRHETGESVYVLEPHEVEKGPGAPEQSVI